MLNQNLLPCAFNEQVTAFQRLVNLKPGSRRVVYGAAANDSLKGGPLDFSIGNVSSNTSPDGSMSDYSDPAGSWLHSIPCLMEWMDEPRAVIV
jgi:hypothetical protein